MKYTCPCCGYKTIEEEPPVHMKFVTYVFGKRIHIQFKEPDYEGGANEVSLRQAQENFIVFGACEKRCIELVRKPTSEDVKDASWKQIC